MFAYIVRRLALMLVTLFGISVIIFVLLRVVPGNIVDILFDAAGFVDPADKANLEKELGLDQPIFVQYLNWIGGLLHGDLGYSYVSEKPALQEILPRIPITARLAALALLFSAAIGIPLGVISAVHQGTRLDYALRVVSLSGLSLPSFWLGLLILMASVSLFGTMPIFNPNPKTWTEAFAIYAVPAMAVGFRSAALTMRITRSSMLEILRQDYIRTARAKGASEASVNYRHALKNAILPVITVIGIEAAFLIGGLIVTETVFNIPGVARFLVEALRWRDYPIVQNLVMLIAVVVVVTNFTVDMLYAAIDPRIRIRTDFGKIWRQRLAVINYDSELQTRRRPFDAWLAPADVPGAALYARHDRPRHHGAVRAGCVARPISSAATIRSASIPRSGWRRRARSTGWEPIRSAATSGAGSSTAPASRSPSASAPPCWARRSASSSASPPAICPAGSTWCSSASPTSCRRCRCWCWRWS